MALKFVYLVNSSHYRSLRFQLGVEQCRKADQWVDFDFQKNFGWLCERGKKDKLASTHYGSFVFAFTIPVKSMAFKNMSSITSSYNYLPYNITQIVAYVASQSIQ